MVGRTHADVRGRRPARGAPSPGQRKVLVLATDPWETGGIQRLTQTLLRAIEELHAPEDGAVVCSRGPVREGDGSRFRVLCSRRRGTGLAVGWLVRIAYVANALRYAVKWRGSVVTIAAHPHLASVGWLCRVVGGGPYAVWCYGLEAWGNLRRRDRFGLERADRLVAISMFTARQVDLQLRRKGPIDVVLPCLDLPASRSAPSSSRRSDGDESPDRGPAPRRNVLSVARLSPEETYKGVDTLVYSWPRVTGQLPDVELVVAGDGPDRARLEHSAALLGLGGRVRFVGQVCDEQLGCLYAEAELFALPARTRLGAKPQGEGFGLVFIEAGAMGLPVVAGRGGGVDEAVIDGETGILVDPDDPDAVADAIRAILSDPEFGRCLGEAGRARVRGELSFEAFRRRVERLMEELVAGPGGMPCAES